MRAVMHGTNERVEAMFVLLFEIKTVTMTLTLKITMITTITLLLKSSPGSGSDIVGEGGQLSRFFQPYYTGI